MEQIELTEKELKQRELNKAKVEAMNTARNIVRPLKQDILDFLSDAEFYSPEFEDALSMLIGTSKGTGKPRGTGERRVTKIDLILSLFTDEDGNREIGKTCSDLDVYMAGRAKKLGMGIPEIKHQIVKLAKEQSIFIDIEDAEDGMLYTYLGTNPEGLHYELVAE